MKSAITTDVVIAPITNGATADENAITANVALAPITSTAARAGDISRSWRDVLPIHLAADKIPQASDNERRGLAGDIARHGQKVPVVLVRVAGGPPQLLDGRHRLDFLEGAGIKVVGDDASMLVQHQIVDVADEAEAERLSLSLNAHRRHLPADERRKLLRAQLKATPEKSDRAIGAIVGMSHHTVAAERTKEEARGQIAHVESRTDTKGRKQPAKKPAAPKTKATAPAAKTATSTVAAIAKNNATDETSVANEASAETTPIAPTASTASIEKEILAVDIEHLANRLVRDDAEGARILHELIVWDDRHALAALAAAVARGLGIEEA